MIILENLSLDEDDPEGVASQREMEALGVLLAEAGHDVDVRSFGSWEYGELRESAGEVFVDVLNVVVDGTAEVAIGAILSQVYAWARKRKRFRGQAQEDRPCVAIWSADGEVLKRVELDEPEEELIRRP